MTSIATTGTSLGRPSLRGPLRTAILVVAVVAVVAFAATGWFGVSWYRAAHGKSLAVGVDRDAVLADAPPREQLDDWRIRHNQTAFMVLVDGADEANSLEALYVGARAILPRSAEPNQIILAIKGVINGLAVLPRELLATLINGASPVDELLDRNDAGPAPLTPRELEVLAAMADGASNKAIARRLGISFHTAKFHVAAILAKLNADSRTEAVTRAAQLGLVML